MRKWIYFGVAFLGGFLTTYASMGKNPRLRQRRSQPVVIATSPSQWTGVAVSKQGRIFVNYPRWSENVPFSVAELKNGKPVPYPSKDWNAYPLPNKGAKGAHFMAVQSVVVDDKDHLWVLDTANPRFGGVKGKGPKLYEFDLQTNELLKSYRFEPGVYASDSYFNDLRVDTEREVAYLTDSGRGALIVLDLVSGESRRLLDGHPSVKAEVDYLRNGDTIWRKAADADGIALTPAGDWLYYIPLTGHSLYRLPTAALRDAALSEEQLAGKVEFVMSVPATDGMLFDQQGNLWMGGLEDNSINVISQGRLYRAAQGPDIRWADSFAEGPGQQLYFSTSQIYLPEGQRGRYELMRLDMADALAGKQPRERILMAVSSHATLGQTPEHTGYYLSEVSHAYYRFLEAGFQVDFVSPKGGEPPVTGLDVKDEENDRFLKDAQAQAAIANSLRPDQVDPARYRAIYYAGGHGVMWDFADNMPLAQLATSIYEQGGVVSAVCHGPAGLVNVRTSDGQYLVAGKHIATFTDEEEKAVKLEHVVPYALETTLRERGAMVESAPLFQEKVVSDGRLVTGQNPASAKGVAEQVVRQLVAKP